MSSHLSPSKIHRLFIVSACSGFLAWTGALSLGGDCPPANAGHPIIETDDYFLSMESSSGAVGDVVGVQVNLHSQVVNAGWIQLQVVACHDPEVAEIVGQPIYSGELLALLGTSGVQFYPVDEAANIPPFDPRGFGYLINLDFNRFGYTARFPSDLPLPLCTVYYRLKGKPGDTGALSFCDGQIELAAARCNYSRIHTYSNENVQGWTYRSRSNQGATLTVLDGPATHPDRPPEPPRAKVYEALPADGQVNFKVRIDGTNATPGAKEVPVDIYASADLEYTGISIPVDFDERYLRLARAEHHFLTGIVLVNNQDNLPGNDLNEGNAVIFSGIGVNYYRLAAESQEILAATLYFDVLEAASEIEETSLSVVSFTDNRGAGYTPWIGVLHKNGVNTGNPIVRNEVAPISIIPGSFKIQPDIVLFIRGDANGNETVDMSDGLNTLEYLFLGKTRPRCYDAADVNDDGYIDLSDPIALLYFLFLGSGKIPEPSGYAGQDPTRDRLGCLYKNQF